MPCAAAGAVHLGCGAVRKADGVGEDKAWKRVKADWRDVVLVCRKCSKKLHGGFGPDGDERFAKALRRSLDDGEMRKPKALRRAVAVIEVGCLDVCPKRAVVVVKGSDPGSLHLVPGGADVIAVADRLGLRGGGVVQSGTAASGEPSRETPEDVLS